MIAVEHMIEWVVRHDGGQAGGRGDKGPEAVPARSIRDDGFQRLAVILCIEQAPTDFGEGFQGGAHRVRFIRNLRLANPFRGPV